MLVGVSTFILRLDHKGAGPRLAVKDLIDLEGTPTTAGSRALVMTRGKRAAASDAPLMAGARAAGARIVGKANLHELAAAPTGVNPWYGTPRNPLDATLIPGGSSSGSAVAVADGDADVAYGSDTGGSVRVPSACCGTAGLKTTFARVPLEGVWPLSPSLDTIGPMARDVAGLVLGMQLLEPGFAAAGSGPTAVGRLRLPDTDPVIEAAVDRALGGAELEVVPVELPGWPAAAEAVTAILASEAFAVNRELFAAHPEAVAEPAASILGFGSTFTPEQVDAARAVQKAWKHELAGVLERVEAIALPTLLCFPPPVDGSEGLDTVIRLVAATAALNLAGVPCVSLPVPAPGGPGLPASLQLVGPEGSEERLLPLAARVEAAVGP
jgi:amidase